jgi:hypothetical protein
MPRHQGFAIRRLVNLVHLPLRGPFDRPHQDRRAVGVEPLERFAREHDPGRIDRLQYPLLGIEHRSGKIDTQFDRRHIVFHRA